MQETELFMELAGIAGVFVGFGALIAIRGGGGASDTFEVAYMRGVVSGGLLAIVAALAPVTLDRYDLSEHQVWALSGAVVLVGFVVMVVVNVLTPEYRADMTGRVASMRPRWRVVAAMAVIGLLFLVPMLAPVIILLSVAPHLEGALYFTAVVVILILDAWWLLQLVFRGRQPAGA